MFVDIKCKGEKYMKTANGEGIVCPVTNSYCVYSAYCIERRRVRHTQRAQECTRRKEIENQK